MEAGVLVVVGAATGALLRWQLTNAGSKYGLSSAATLSINTVGSFILGGCCELTNNKLLTRQQMLFMGTGFCGSFTTLSTFSVDVMSLIQRDMYGRAFTLAASTNLLGVSVSKRIK